MTNARNLRCCPFCGERELLFSVIDVNEQPSQKYIECQVCGSTGPRAEFAEDEANAAWTERANAAWDARA